jgi:hypothetical protein
LTKYKKYALLKATMLSKRRLKMKTLAVLVLLIAMSGLGMAEQFASAGGVIPYAYDPYNNGLGSTVWVWNAHSYPVY